MSNLKSKVVTLREFLEDVPPGVVCQIKEVHVRRRAGGDSYYVTWPEVRVWCSNEECQRASIHDTSDEWDPITDHNPIVLVTYTCRHCDKSAKHYAVHGCVGVDDSGPALIALKVGEFPMFGPPTPRRLTKLLGDLAGLYRKGQRFETQGLGIGAFTYYRRIVEAVKNTLLDQMIGLAKELGGHADFIDQATRAKSQVQFRAAVESINATIPEAFLVKGHNPLTLLHAALSKGVHVMTDEECLERAQHIRTIMTALAERLAELRHDDAAIRDAIKGLARPPKPAAK